MTTPPSPAPQVWAATPAPAVEPPLVLQSPQAVADAHAPLVYLGHPAPDGMIVDRDGLPCRRESAECRTKGEMVDGKRWPHWPIKSPAQRVAEARELQDSAPSLADRYDAITQQRAEVQARIAALTVRSTTCYDPDPCRAAIDGALMDCVNHDAALSRQQAELMITAQARASKNWTESDQP